MFFKSDVMHVVQFNSLDLTAVVEMAEAKKKTGGRFKIGGMQTILYHN